MSAVTIWLIPLLLAAAGVLLAVGAIVSVAARHRDRHPGFALLWAGVTALVLAATAYVGPMLVLGFAARPA
jgi:hypothetical protein